MSNATIEFKSKLTEAAKAIALEVGEAGYAGEKLPGNYSAVRLGSDTFVLTRNGRALIPEAATMEDFQQFHKDLGKGFKDKVKGFVENRNKALEALTI